VTRFGDHIAAASTAPHIAQTHAKIPTGFEPGVKYEAGQPSEVTLALREIPEDEAQWRDKIHDATHIDIPKDRRVELTQVRYWGDPASPMIYVRFHISDRAPDADVDVAELVKVARSNRPKGRPLKRASHGLRVVVTSDPQVGKVDSDGGTAALFSRVESMLGQLDDVMREEPCDEAIVADPGDIVEGFENTAQQSHTNDLSHPDQLQAARGLLTEIVTTVAMRHVTNRVVTVPSNHGQWRKGKDVLGRPGDDYGIDIHRAVAEALARDLRFEDVAFTIPDPWRESLAVQARGAVLGMFHGHQVKQGRAWEWWKGQIAGDLPTAAANILIGGHYHSWLTVPHGRLGGQPRWFFQADTLDGGSAWWANLTGDQSEPALMTFTIDDEGRWHNLRRITQAR